MTQLPKIQAEPRDLERDLVVMLNTLMIITSQLRAEHADTDQPVIRAEEATSAMQRLIWAIQGRHPSDRA